MYQFMDKVVAYNSVYDIISPPMVAFLGVVEFILARSLWWYHTCANMSFDVSLMFHSFPFPFLFLLLFSLFTSSFLLFFLLFFQSVSFKLILNKEVILPHSWPKWQGLYFCYMHHHFPQFWSICVKSKRLMNFFLIKL